MNVFSKIIDVFRDKTVANLCADLRALGIDAEVTGESGKKRFNIWRSLGSIKVHGRQFDAIHVSRNGFTDQHVSWVWYEIDFLVRVAVLSMPKELKAASRRVKKGLVFRKLADVQWAGGMLADALNRDMELEKMLLAAFQSQNEVQILVNPVDGDNYAAITMTHVGHSMFKPRPIELTANDIGLINRIATHIHRLAG